MRQALDRVLAEDVISPVERAGPRQLGDGRLGGALSPISPPSGETRLKNVGTAFAGRAFDGKVGAGETVRIMTGAVAAAGRRHAW